ncbi:TonB-dependent receptor [Sphingobium sp. TA15]|uniref:TonB-dependent receptor-like protein n=1 Tax=Sphingobium indicum (strain DSM 16413 / CCM 7287 / MTCC 6362 / UT26 / NBRC 101211 / UT26S) TaxID=452662 RepID=D4Z8F8_SPHIU|nr:TonB-dependent receptor [Sphingobium indicum]BAI98777.1 TonB-dependent receptor-like protein [Sphingobium indicum UT26S]BDD68824.1 TonB-dependent receptor [Sphingobium sp. TA15]
MRNNRLLLAGVGLMSLVQAAHAQDAAAPQADVGIGEIIVTAQKRAQSLNDVPITVAVASGEQLAQRGITDTADLGKVVSGFVAVPAPFGQPVYVLRGIGLYDSGLGSAPTVSVYVDQVSLPFSLMTQGAALDLERVEVLKGPQGTLFGTNNTGGAINYVAAKPTEDFQAGGSATYERFDKATLKAFVSGPITDTLRARVAVQGASGGAWQRSLTRDDELGNARQIMGRLLLDWTPTDRLKVAINLNGFRDRSDTQASQLKAITPSDPAFAYPEMLAAPLAEDNARSADWNPLASNRKNEKFYQLSGRVDFEATDTVTLTSISSYSDLKSSRYLDIDGAAPVGLEFQTFGRLKDFGQELRLQLTTDALIGLVGVNYQHSNTKDNNFNFVDKLSTNRVGGLLAATPFTRPTSYVNQQVDNYAIFANAEYKITPQLTFQAGGRYTWSERDAQACAYDRTPGAPLNIFFTGLQSILAPGVVQDPITKCYQLNPYDNFSAGEFDLRLREDNFSYRGALNYKFDGGTMIFGSVSRGYKGAIISNITASSAQQFLPVKQERLDSYEIGIKAPLFDRAAFLNVSGFYYDYKNKQLRARILDPIFGLVETLVSVPKSRIWGIDADLNFAPAEGLTLTASGTYLNSKINGDFTTSNGAAVYDQAGQSGNFRGSPLSYTPKFTGNLDVQYEWPLSDSFKAMLGAAVTYHSRDNASLVLQGNSRDRNFDIPRYALLDLRAGISAADDRWRVELFGRNVTNKYYITTVFQDLDNRHQYAGMPATYGITFGFKY